MHLQETGEKKESIEKLYKIIKLYKIRGEIN